MRLPDPATARFATLTYANPAAPRPPPVLHFATPPGKPLLVIGRADADIVLDQPLVVAPPRRARVAGRPPRAVATSRRRTARSSTALASTRRARSRRATSCRSARSGSPTTATASTRSTSAARSASTRRRSATRSATRRSSTETTVSIEPCELVAVVGHSGAGKSTLMMALCGFQPRDPRARRDQRRRPVRALSTRTARMLGYVPQDDILHRALTVDARAATTRRGCACRPTPPTPRSPRASRACSRRSTWPATQHQRIDALSGGQRKRVSIACELLADPVLLFLDEPTSGLDPGLERKLMYTLRKLADGGRTIVLVTHATANIEHVRSHRVPGRRPHGLLRPARAGARRSSASTTSPTSTRHRPSRRGRRDAGGRRGIAASLQYQKYVVERPARAPAAPSVEQRAETAAARADVTHSSRWRQLAILHAALPRAGARRPQQPRAAARCRRR